MNTTGTANATYMSLALQVTCHAVSMATSRDEVQGKMNATLDRLAQQIAASKAFIGNDLKLVVLPEYFLTGFPMQDSITAWRDKAALEIDGPEYDRMGEICQSLGIYLGGNAYELDPHFPELYFQTSFLIDDSGQVVLRYRRLNSMYAPTPHDVWDRYLDIYGLDGVFPVARTPYGNFAAMASEEILYPELARCLAMRGAEIFLHPTSESHGDGDTPKEVAKRARAIENLAYVVSANSSGIVDTPIPASSTDGGSKVIDYRGQVLVKSRSGESMVAHAPIDLQALRAYRRRPGMMNLLARQRFELYGESYSKNQFHPPNSMLDQKHIERQLFRETQEETIRRLDKAGII